MRNITLTIIALFSLLGSKMLLADQTEPHIEATPDCPEDQICCPSELYCSYKEGCGESNNWVIDNSYNNIQSFEGVQRFILTRIIVRSLTKPDDIEHKIHRNYYGCSYNSPEIQDAFSSITLIPWGNNNYKLIGNWRYLYFGSYTAECNTNNPLDCTVIKMN